MLLQLVQIALGHRKKLSRSLSVKEWWQLYDIVLKQAISGVCFAGVEKLPKEQLPPDDLLFEWYGDVTLIKQRNQQIDEQTATIWKKLKDDGLYTAILKGQGIAQEYGELASLRQPGDIDIWAKGGYNKVCNYVQRTIPTDDVSFLNFGYIFFKETVVELHFRPAYAQNLFVNRTLSRWYDSFGTDSFVYLEDKGFAVPPVLFNVIFILSHIYKHFLGMGIGLRQVMDYYFVLKNCQSDNVRPAEKTNITETLKDLRLTRFAGAMMWILHTQFGLEEQHLICGMNEKEGRFVLSEIMQTGNFGQGDSRYQFKRFFRLRHHLAHGCHLLMHYPSEVLWTPIWLVYKKTWIWKKKREIGKILK